MITNKEKDILYSQLIKDLSHTTKQMLNESKEYLSDDEKRGIYETVMGQMGKTLWKHLNELSNETVKDASKKASARMNQLLRKDEKTGKYTVDEKKFQEYLDSLTNEARKKRLMRLYKEGKLADKIISQTHMLCTVANSDLEWIRDNTDISLSPEFFQSETSGDTVQAWGAEYKTSSRKPTKDEHDFYRFFTSMGTDTSGMTPENIKRYKAAWREFYIATMGIDPIGL